MRIPLAILALSILSQRCFAQDTSDTGDNSGDTGGGDVAASSAAAAAPSDDGAQVASSTPAPVGSASPSAATSGTASSSGNSTTNNNMLGGAGNGQAYPTACASCSGTYTSVVQCTNAGTNEACSPLCSNYKTTVSCISCLVSNGQPDIDQDTAQQIVWNLEASCQNIGSAVGSTIPVTAAPTATGPFTTPPGGATSGSGGPTTSHSGLTAYTSVHPFDYTGTHTILAQNPSGATSSGAASPQYVSSKSLSWLGIFTLGGLTALVVV